MRPLEQNKGCNAKLTWKGRHPPTFKFSCPALGVRQKLLGQFALELMRMAAMAGQTWFTGHAGDDRLNRNGSVCQWGMGTSDF